jgi:hypothetical protein
LISIAINARADWRVFHKLPVKCQNELGGRRENLWSNEQVCVVQLGDLADVMRKLIYTATTR